MIGRYRKHDPKGLVPKHASHVSMSWTYAHEKWEEELFTENAQYWQEVQRRKSNPIINIFASLLIEEHIKMVKVGVSSSKGPSIDLQGGERDPMIEKE